MNKPKLFLASCISLATASMVFAIRGDVAGPLSQSFHITNEQMGLVFSPAFWAFTMAILSAAISSTSSACASCTSSAIGSSRAWCSSYSLHIRTNRSSPVRSPSTTLLYAGFSCWVFAWPGRGVINPLMASLYPDEKNATHYVVHAGGGGSDHRGLLAVLMSNLESRATKLSLSSCRHHYLVMASRSATEDRARDVERVDRTCGSRRRDRFSLLGVHVDDAGDRDGPTSGFLE